MKFTSILSASQSASLPVRPSCTRCMVTKNLHDKGNHIVFIKLLLKWMNVYPLYHAVSFYTLLLSFHLQIAYRKVRNLQICVDKLVGKASINLLSHTKSAAGIIIDAPAVAYAHS